MCKSNNFLNNDREKIIMQGHANITEIQAFIPCGYKTALKIQNEIIEKVKANGKSILKTGKRFLIKPMHLLEYINLTEKQVHEYAKIEREKVTAVNSN